MDFSAHYKKANLWNFGCGMYFLVAALFMEISETQLWISLAVVIILPRLFIRLSKPDRVQFRDSRKAILKTKPGLAYSALFLNWIVPLGLAVAAYYLLSFSYYRALFLFVGSSTLFVIVSNLRFEPLHNAEIGKVFD